MTELRLVTTELEDTLIECRRRWAGLGAKLLMVERTPTFEGARQVEHLAGLLEEALGRLALLIEEMEEA